MRRRRSLALFAAVLAALLWAPTLAAASPPDGPSAKASEKATGWYLALGDSLGAGYQPTTGLNPKGGYVGGVLDAVRTTAPKTKLVNLSCSGERVTWLVSGGHCTYEEGSQLAQAVEFLHAHAAFTRLVTIDIGANDVQRCADAATLTVDQACIAQGMADVAQLLPQALAALRAAAPDTKIVVLNYYNPFLAAWPTGPQGQALAGASMLLQAQLNGIIAGAAAGVGAEVADVATAFESTNTTMTPAGVPVNVLRICTWTWMCSRVDIHANDTGYAVMATAVAARL